MTEALIIDAVRTPFAKGRPSGALAQVHPVDLLAHPLRTLVERNGVDAADLDDVIIGCVSQSSEQSINVARNGVLAAGFPERVPATTIDRQCGSSQQAVHFAAQGVLAGSYDLVIAGGVESMSRVPMGSSVQGAHGFGNDLRRVTPRAWYPRGSVPSSSRPSGEFPVTTSTSSDCGRSSWPPRHATRVASTARSSPSRRPMPTGRWWT